jgi:hypothetical protein
LRGPPFPRPAPDCPIRSEPSGSSGAASGGVGAGRIGLVRRAVPSCQGFRTGGR